MHHPIPYSRDRIAARPAPRRHAIRLHAHRDARGLGDHDRALESGGAVAPRFGERQRPSRGAGQLQSWLNLAKNRALRDQRPRGIRLPPVSGVSPGSERMSPNCSSSNCRKFHWRHSVDSRHQCVGDPPVPAEPLSIRHVDRRRTGRSVQSAVRRVRHSRSERGFRRRGRSRATDRQNQLDGDARARSCSTACSAT